jgi:hypothetical protein
MDDSEKRAQTMPPVATSYKDGLLIKVPAAGISNVAQVAPVAVAASDVGKAPVAVASLDGIPSKTGDRSALGVNCVCTGASKNVNSASPLDKPCTFVMRQLNGQLITDDDPICAAIDESLSPRVDSMTSPVPLTVAADNHSRFRVVKIDSSEPATHRGRWVCLNFPDSAAPALSIGRAAADWLHDDVGYSSGSSVSSSGPGAGGQNPLLYCLCDGDLPPIGSSASRIRSDVGGRPVVLFQDQSADVAWFVGSDERVAGLREAKSPLCIITHGSDVGNPDDLAECDDPNGRSVKAMPFVDLVCGIGVCCIAHVRCHLSFPFPRSSDPIGMLKILPRVEWFATHVHRFSVSKRKCSGRWVASEQTGNANK